MTVTVADIVALLERRYPPTLAADWDAVGLACGDPHATVRRILVAIDPVEAVVDEALVEQADLIVTHHPLFLHGVHSVAPIDARGRVAHTLITHGIALYCAHTNADHARPGVSDALADALGVVETMPIDPERPGFDVGTGRVGRLAEPVTLAAFVERVATVLPATAAGVRAAGDPERVIRTVALCGGAGDSLLDVVTASDADVYVTSDLRHHRAQDFLVSSDAALVDVAHWAAEWTWLPALADALRADVAGLGSTVEVHVSSTPTDPWTLHRGSLR